MKMKRYATFDEYFADQSPKNRSIIRALRKFVGREAPHLEGRSSGATDAG